uniref:Uncharacterized protein n=1 Tax=Anopheles atroparvus TaxID=41427 RepID=A0A182JAR8_ANOAO
MPPFVLSTLLLCRWSEDSLSDFGDSRNRSARGMVVEVVVVVVVLLALLSVPWMELCGARAGGLLGLGPEPPSPNELLTVAVSRAAGALLTCVEPDVEALTRVNANVVARTDGRPGVTFGWQKLHTRRSQRANFQRKGNRIFTEPLQECFLSTNFRPITSSSSRPYLEACEISVSNRGVIVGSGVGSGVIVAGPTMTSTPLSGSITPFRATSSLLPRYNVSN